MGILSQNGGSRAANTIIQKADIQEGESLEAEAFNFIPQNICFFFFYKFVCYVIYNQLLIIKTNSTNLAGWNRY